MPRRSLAALVCFVLAAASVFAWASDWLTLAWLKANRDALIDFCQRDMAVALLVYVGAFAAWAALCLPGVGLFALAGGLVFGQALGTLLATLAAVSGATVAFLAARYWFHDWAHARFAGAFAVIDRGVKQDGAFYVFMMRLVVFVPFFLINPLMGLTDMRTRTFVWASTLGMLANSFLWVNAGTMLASIDRVEDVFSWPVLLSFAAVGILPLGFKWLFLRGK